ncbi:MAG: hypothetical protein WCX12_01905 [Candidatus Paceibacterota bacterium]|jgi:hypothetical protein
MIKKILLVLFVVLILSLIVYLFTGGLIKKLGGSLNSTSTTSFFSFGSLFGNSSSSHMSYQGYQGGNQVLYTSTSAVQQYISSSSSGYGKSIPEGFTKEDLSPNAGKVRIGSISGGWSGSYGQISLISGIMGDTKIDITGWQIKGRTGLFYLPKAVPFYSPSGLDAPTDIILGKGEIVNIYSSASAIGINLRLNKCLGYIENTNHFTPTLPKSCPRPIDEVSGVYNFSSKCQDYVTSLGSCSFPNISQLWLQNSNEYACRSFLESINYKGCFDKHRSDSNFLSNEWRVWAGSKFLDPRHDRVLLFDAKGLLVDSATY